MYRSIYATLFVVLLSVHAALLLVSSRRNFVVLDEAGHIPAGLSHWELGDFSLYRVNPPLGRMVATLPLVASHPRISFRGLDHTPGARGEFEQAPLFAELNGPRYFDLVRLARLAGIVWSLLGAWLIYAWGSELYGPAGGLLGAMLWCFDPTVLAFSPVVTPDIPAAVAGLAATYVYWRFLRNGTWSTALLAGLLLGIAQLLKFTNLTLYGVWTLLYIAYRSCRREGAYQRPLVIHLLFIFVISLYIINLGYGFHESCLRLGRIEFVSRLFTGIEPPAGQLVLPKAIGNRFQGGWLAEVPVPIPAEFLRGIDLQRKDFEVGFPSYLAGQWRDRGWWYYYIYALAVKEPLGTITLVLWTLSLTIRRYPASASRFNEAALLLPAGVVLALVSSQTGFNHHMRYMIPAFPFLAVATGKLAWYFTPGRRGLGLLVGGLLIWSVGSSLSVYPHSMSYFNEAVGGPTRGHLHLVDSNIDWGQDLFYLKEWLDRHPDARPFGLAYFNVLDPTIFGIDFEPPPPGPDETTPRDPAGASRFGPRPGYYAVSVHLLQGGKYSIPDGHGGRVLINRHDHFAYFHLFQPIARAGYSLLIYHITPAQADAARRRLRLPPLPQREALPGG